MPIATLVEKNVVYKCLCIVYYKYSGWEKRFNVCLEEEEISIVPEESKNISEWNMFDRCADRTNLLYKKG